MSLIAYQSIILLVIFLSCFDLAGAGDNDLSRNTHPILNPTTTGLLDSQSSTSPPISLFYRALDGAIYGPYTKQQILDWLSAGYFTPDLPVSIDGVVFEPLQRLGWLENNSAEKTFTTQESTSSVHSIYERETKEESGPDNSLLHAQQYRQLPSVEVPQYTSLDYSNRGALSGHNHQPGYPDEFKYDSYRGYAYAPAMSGPAGSRGSRQIGGSSLKQSFLSFAKKASSAIASRLKTTQPRQIAGLPKNSINPKSESASISRSKQLNDEVAVLPVDQEDLEEMATAKEKSTAKSKQQSPYSGPPDKIPVESWSTSNKERHSRAVFDKPAGKIVGQNHKMTSTNADFEKVTQPSQEINQKRSAVSSGAHNKPMAGVNSRAISKVSVRSLSNGKADYDLWKENDFDGRTGLVGATNTELFSFSEEQSLAKNLRSFLFGGVGAILEFVLSCFVPLSYRRSSVAIVKSANPSLQVIRLLTWGVLVVLEYLSLLTIGGLLSTLNDDQYILNQTSVETLSEQDLTRTSLISIVEGWVINAGSFASYNFWDCFTRCTARIRDLDLHYSFSRLTFGFHHFLWGLINIVINRPKESFLVVAMVGVLAVEVLFIPSIYSKLHSNVLFNEQEGSKVEDLSSDDSRSVAFGSLNRALLVQTLELTKLLAYSGAALLVYLQLFQGIRFQSLLCALPLLSTILFLAAELASPRTVGMFMVAQSASSHRNVHSPAAVQSKARDEFKWHR